MRRKVLLLFFIFMFLFLFTGCDQEPELETFELTCEDCHNKLHISSDFDDSGKIFYCDDSLYPIESGSYCPVCSYKIGREYAIEEILEKFEDGIAVDAYEMQGIIYEYIDDCDLADEIIEDIFSKASVNLNDLTVDK